ncbi:TPA: hypothetical protein ACTZ42_003784 [Bacillus cereus]
MKKYQIFYSVFSPSGQQYEEKFITIYAPSVEHARRGIEKELQRRLGNLYQWDIDVQQIENEQLALL